MSTIISKKNLPKPKRSSFYHDGLKNGVGMSTANSNTRDSQRLANGPGQMSENSFDMRSDDRLFSDTGNSYNNLRLQRHPNKNKTTISMPNYSNIGQRLNSHNPNNKSTASMVNQGKPPNYPGYNGLEKSVNHASLSGARRPSIDFGKPGSGKNLSELSQNYNFKKKARVLNNARLADYIQKILSDVVVDSKSGDFLAFEEDLRKNDFVGSNELNLDTLYALFEGIEFRTAELALSEKNFERLINVSKVLAAVGCAQKNWKFMVKFLTVIQPIRKQ